MGAYYNEIDPFCCEVLRARMADGRLPEGQVDGRDVREVRPDEIPAGQVHLFAGIGGFAYAARLAGLPDDFDIWTAGFPCQDISTAGKGAGLHGSRSGLFFEIVRLLRGIRRRPAWVLLENVPALLLRGSDGVLDEMAALGYSCWPLVVGAWAVGAPHKRNRVWIACRLDNTQCCRRPGGELHRGDQPQALCGGTAGASVPAGQIWSMVNPTGARCTGNPGCETSRAVRDETRGPEFARPCGLQLADARSIDDGGGAGARGGLEAGREAEGQGRQAGSDGAFHGGQVGGVADAEPNGRRAGSGEPRSTEGPGQWGSEPAGNRWPSRPGEPQHEWEASRLLELPMGGLIDGIPARLVRLANRNALKAYGNSIVPQVAAEVMRAIMGMSE